MTTPPPNYPPNGQPHAGQPYPGGPGATAFAPPPPPKKRRVWLWVLIAVLAFFLILLVACTAIISSAAKSAGTAGGTSASTSGSGDDQNDQPSQAPSKKAVKPQMAGIGDTVKAGDWQFKVTDFECGHSRVGNSTFGEKAQGQFCFLKVSAKNNGDDEGTLTDSEQKLTDDGGRSYSSDSAAALYQDPQDAFFVKGVNPGNTAKGLIVFDVPKTAKITEASLTGGLFGDSAKVSLR